jgi:hypothetical protein
VLVQSHSNPNLGNVDERVAMRRLLLTFDVNDHCVFLARNFGLTSPDEARRRGRGQHSSASRPAKAVDLLLQVTRPSETWHQRSPMRLLISARFFLQVALPKWYESPLLKM